MNVNFVRCFMQKSTKFNQLTKNLLWQNNNNFLNSASHAVNYSVLSKIDVTNFYKSSKRCYSDEKRPNPTSENDTNKLPPLMDFPQITWPSLFKTIKNFFIVSFIIMPYFEKDFLMSDFVKGSKKAVEVISKKLSNGDIKALEGLLSSDIVPTLQNALSLMSLVQREQIAVEVDDIYFAFPYQIGVIIKEEESREPIIQKRFVEITMVYHCLKGLALMRSRGEEPPINMGVIPEYQNKISICNYRFVREFTKGVEGDWTVNLLNHFKPMDNTR